MIDALAAVPAPVWFAGGIVLGALIVVAVENGRRQ